METNNGGFLQSTNTTDQGFRVGSFFFLIILSVKITVKVKCLFQQCNVTNTDWIVMSEVIYWIKKGVNKNMTNRTSTTKLVLGVSSTISLV